MAIYFSSVHISDNNTGKWGSFYALKWGAALLNVHGGVIIDTKMRVLDKDHKPIPGLLAVGNVSGGLYGVDYPLLLNGNSHGLALTWALQATDTILAEN